MNPELRARRDARRRWLVAALVCAAVFVAASLELRAGGRWLGAFDAAVAGWLRAWRTPQATVTAIDLTALGSASVVTLVTLVCCALYALGRDWRAIVHIAVASAGGGVLTRLIKLHFERPRPADLPPLVQALGYSFPSGHTVMATALYLTFAVLACRVFRGGRERVAVFAIAVLVIVLIGATRVYLGVHHPSDVLGGAAVGSAWACLLAAALGHPAVRR
jgi:undecaprenyl-diphosphatase